MINPKNLSCVIIQPNSYQYKDKIIYEIDRLLRLRIPVIVDNYIISKKKAEIIYWNYRGEASYLTAIEALSNKPTCKMFITGMAALEKIAQKAEKITKSGESRENRIFYSWRDLWGGNDFYQNVVLIPTTPEELKKHMRIHFSLTEMEKKLHLDLLRYLFDL